MSRRTAKLAKSELASQSRRVAPLGPSALLCAFAVRLACAGECASSQPSPAECAGDAAGEVTGAPLSAEPGGVPLAPARRAESQPAGSAACPRESIVPATAKLDLDPAVFFERLAHRYRKLHSYRDTIRLVHVTTRGGEEASRVETEIGCEVRDGDLRVVTPTAQARDALRVALPVRDSPAAAQARRGYDLWLAPHMTLKFDDQPLKRFRAGVDEGFTATEAQAVTINDRTMVHLELRSGDGLSDDCAAKFDLFVNPETMLVECIAGEQHLPDGASTQTTLHIAPQESEGGEPTLMQ